MENLKINTGTIKLSINDTKDYIEFNPKDVNFIENLYSLIKDFELKSKEYKEQYNELNIKDVDKFGIPINMAQGFNLIRETADYMKEKIDNIFGEETSKKVFGSAITLDMFEQFFDNIATHIEIARKEKTDKYLKQEKKKVIK